MSSDTDAMALKEAARAEYYARWEAVEAFKAQELAAMTDERAREIIKSLGSFGEPWRNPLNGMGLVEQQRIFHNLKHS